MDDDDTTTMMMMMMMMMIKGAGRRADGCAVAAACRLDHVHLHGPHWSAIFHHRRRFVA
jgi:hypothetical protein